MSYIQYYDNRSPEYLVEMDALRNVRSLVKTEGITGLLLRISDISKELAEFYRTHSVDESWESFIKVANILKSTGHDIANIMFEMEKKFQAGYRYQKDAF